jgi:hypothetical protein
MDKKGIRRIGFSMSDNPRNNKFEQKRSTFTQKSIVGENEWTERIKKMEEAPDAGALVKIKILSKTKSSFSLSIQS